MSALPAITTTTTTLLSDSPQSKSLSKPLVEMPARSAIGRSTVESLRRRLNTVRGADRMTKFLVSLKERTDCRRTTKRRQYSSTFHTLSGGANYASV